MNDSERLQAHLALMRGDPVVPLTGIQAIKQACKLRSLGISYASIALVMGVYHGEWYTARRWGHVCRKAGTPATRGDRMVLP